ncbi:hypothetical protein WME76_04055 [Sorangium sp. So ce119]|uniref:hypothetical protein n=1 Tax=Sorangium sp. So ce119 TaxID=3133279 RepID=UPI003F619CE4
MITAQQRRAPEDRIGTHDHFNRIGVSVTRVLNAAPCPLLRAGVDDARSPGLPACWETTGDGFLGTSPASQDRLHAAEATARAQVQLAMALDPRWVERLLEPAACGQVWLSAPLALRGASDEQPMQVSWNPSFLMGISYRWQYVLSGRPNAALFEANVGLQTTVRSGGRSHFGSSALTELRTPVLSMMFWAMANGVTRAFDGGRGLADTADVIELMPCGARFYFDLTSSDRPFFDGFDVEGPALLLPLERDLLGTQGVSRMPLEIRSRFGCAQRCQAFSVSLELATGVSRLF